MGHGIDTLWPRDWKNFTPRFGFAYQPKGSGKIVVRGGYGIYYQVPNVNYFADNRPGDGGATRVLANTGGISPVYMLSNQTPLTIQNDVPVFRSSAFPSGPFGAFSVSQHFIACYVQNDSLNVQYRINPATVLEVCYVGSLSRHLPATLDINQIPPGSTSNTARPSYNQFPNLAAINEVQSVANACYNAAIISLRSSNYHGFTMKFNYTYSHSRDDLSSTRGVIPQNSCNLRDDYGNSDFDVRHSFSGLVGYNVPSPSRYNCCSRNCNWTRC